jgi:hypothetical protein
MMLRKWLHDRNIQPLRLLGRRRRQPDRRGAPRYDVQLSVGLRRQGLAPIAGSVINLSRTGAAVRVHGWNVPVPAAWPTRLGHGDELWLTGLLDAPVSCWVISVDEAVVRVRFSLGDSSRAQLDELLHRLASSTV